ncbi:DUF4097 domain-containing protein [Ruminococcus sp. CLA-AA-H200]|uniref:DUF4097 domain-containing protein n=1 Tax=Ruminococcus turbiniformis TaxID=2881258 RepID=A0ABS8FYJ9_9FIRM|nr:DUF4097 family beta strand repeat-containing protein [Ruminococcus turbiniformis]MCC2255132.1 DUF4097 domain-containing protein [Ruminococcus turbiniformis]
MRKGWKIFWIVCAVLAAVGLFSAVAGTALGGLTILRTGNQAERLVSWLDRLGIDGKTEFSGSVEDPKDLPDIIEEEINGGAYSVGDADGVTVIDYEGVDRISLDADGIGISVKPYDGEYVRVDTSRLREDLQGEIQISQDGGELDVELKRQNWGTEDSGMLYINVPQGSRFREISAEVGAGLLEMEGIETEEMSLDVGAGQISAGSFYAEKLEADCGAGQIVLDGETVSEAKLSCDLGEIRYTAAGQMETYDYEVSCSAGEIVIGSESYSGINNKIDIDNGSGSRIEADCKMGRIEISFQ